MKKKILTFGLAFVVATIVFSIISMVFGSDLFVTFTRLTDGWIFGVLLLCFYDMFRRLCEGERLTKTYIAVQCLFLVNVVAFSYASTSVSTYWAGVALLISFVSGVSAIALPYIVGYIEDRRADNNDPDGEVDEDTLQKEWNTFVSKLMKISDKNRQKELLQKKLAFRLIGDNIFNALDVSRGMVVVDDLSMTVEMAVKNGVEQSKIDEANEYIDRLIGIGG